MMEPIGSRFIVSKEVTFNKTHMVRSTNTWIINIHKNVKITHFEMESSNSATQDEEEDSLIPSSYRGR